MMKTTHCLTTRQVRFCPFVNLFLFYCGRYFVLCVCVCGGGGGGGGGGTFTKMNLIMATQENSVFAKT